MTRKPEAGLNEECLEIVHRAFAQYKDKDPLFIRHWIFENAVLEAYQLGISKEQKRHSESKPISQKEISSFLYQTNLKYIKLLEKSDVEKNGINIVTPKNCDETESRFVYLYQPIEIQREIDNNNETLMIKWKSDNRWERYNPKTFFGEIWQYEWRITK